MVNFTLLLIGYYNIPWNIFEPFSSVNWKQFDPFEACFRVGPEQPLGPLPKRQDSFVFPAYHEDFPLTGGNTKHPSPVRVLGIVLPVSWGGPFLALFLYSFFTCLHWSVFSLRLKGIPQEISRNFSLCNSFLSTQLSPLWGSALWLVAGLASPNSQLRLFNSGRLPGLVWISSPCTEAWKRGSELGTS